MSKEAKGYFTKIADEEFYKIENYDCMEDFFITLTSSSDIWNFLWSKGGITAGRKNSDYAIFQYGTADKVSDYKFTSGPYTAVAVCDGEKVEFWEPFSKFYTTACYASSSDDSVQYNIYKNFNGSKIWFEEINNKLELSFRYGWTSSKRFGLVKSCVITNLSDKKRTLKVLDGAKNIMPSLTSNDLQNNNSVLVNAYKKTDLDLESQLTIFSLSSAVADKAEPLEALVGNICWFTTEDKVHINPEVVPEFFKTKGTLNGFEQTEVLKGQRSACFIVHNVELDAKKEESWQCAFDVSLNVPKIADLKKLLSDRKKAAEELNKDIAATDALLTKFVQEADGIQSSSSKITAVHHRTNVMFNIMRGGFFADNGKVYFSDLLKSYKQRNVAAYEKLKKYFEKLPEEYSFYKQEFHYQISNLNEPQVKRLFLEYLPVIFSRRHGDPSRPWNKFNIALTDEKGNQVLNYEGNWRDIFQNWEALLYSYPEYIQNVVAKFVNAMTMDGYNPYRISREGIDWECPEPNNPWASYGYWGDHQVIYLQKLLEALQNYDEETLVSFLSEKIFSSSNVPYRLRSYEEICENPRDSLIFDKELSDRLIKASKEFGTDQKLVLNKDGDVELLTLSAKILQIVISKMANLIPGGGIWMNTQRPEWNDANNALCGWGLSVVTVCYLERMLKFLISLYEKNHGLSFEIPVVMADCLKELTEIFQNTAESVFTDDVERKNFADKAQKAFETERNALYKDYYGQGFVEVISIDLLDFFKASEKLVAKTIEMNRISSGLYHTYNTVTISGNKMTIEYLQNMLEGQVAVLSSKLLSSCEVLKVCEALRESKMYEARQNSYMLYPNKELPLFMEKNKIAALENSELAEFLEKDCNGNYHFEASCQNQRLLTEYLNKRNVSDSKKKELLDLYESVFNHHAFTGRSGTFYAYEGLGSIYWHMVSKLLLAVQEATLEAYKTDDKNKEKLLQAYNQIKEGLGSAKTPEIYGAFPYDPYSHTPFGKGAQQPGMTGQVKEEVLTRFGELGLSIEDGCAVFNPLILSKDEFNEAGELEFSWCGTPVTYKTASEEKAIVYFCDNSKLEQPGEVLSKEVSEELFSRSGAIKKIEIFKII